MSEAEWAVCGPLLPAPAWLAGRGGRPASWCMREVVDAIRYLTHNGPVWRALPGGFPPAGTRHRRTVRDYERVPARHETYIHWAMIIVMTRRLARQPVIAQPAAI